MLPLHGNIFRDTPYNVSVTLSTLLGVKAAVIQYHMLALFVN